MSERLFLSREGLAGWIADLTAAGVRVVAPAEGPRGRTEYRAIRETGEAKLDGTLPAMGLKSLFLPPTETLFGWRRSNGEIVLEPTPDQPRPTVVIGARPCDAAGPEILDRVMGWDYKDEPWFRRREATAIVGVACPGADGSCFCDEVGLGRESTRGSDLFLRPADGGFVVEVVTDRGRELISEDPARFDTKVPAGAGTVSTTAPSSAHRTDTSERGSIDSPVPDLSHLLSDGFAATVWSELGLRCHGCGACASVCPTCHCFDIVDEPESVDTGVRRRNWDTCQAGLFTVHASGHNPRADQNARFRQRVLHKFAIYPLKFGTVLCTGCGRCSRTCPAGQDLGDVLRRVGAAVSAGAGR